MGKERIKKILSKLKIIWDGFDTDVAKGVCLIGLAVSIEALYLITFIEMSIKLIRQIKETIL
jgi:hypothetical protein